MVCAEVAVRCAQLHGSLKKTATATAAEQRASARPRAKWPPHMHTQAPITALVRGCRHCDRLPVHCTWQWRGFACSRSSWQTGSMALVRVLSGGPTQHSNVAPSKCAMCGITCRTAGELHQHFLGKKHRAALLDAVGPGACESAQRRDVAAARDAALLELRECGGRLKHASAQLRADHEAVRLAVQQNCRALQHAAAELRGDRGIVMAALGCELGEASRGAVAAAEPEPAPAPEPESESRSMPAGWIYSHSERISIEGGRGDQARGHVLRFASEALRNDREVVFAARRVLRPGPGIPPGHASCASHRRATWQCAHRRVI